MLGDKEPVDFTEELVSIEAQAANEYVGLGYGIGGPLWVKVAVDDGKLTGVEVFHQLETPGVGSRAIDALPEQMVAADGIDVDDFSGATSTSQALKAAVADALEQAGIATA